jgi:hypothetical protein
MVAEMENKMIPLFSMVIINGLAVMGTLMLRKKLNMSSTK